MKKNAPFQPDASRPKQELPQDIIASLMQSIRGGFYGDCPEKWHADQRFILKNVVTWPAGWLNKRAVTLAPGRYREILLEVFNGIKQHGNTGTVKYWPGYLMHCVQEHFKVHGEAYYNEGKSLRTQAERVMFSFSKQAEAQGPDPIEALAGVHRALQVAGRKAKAAPVKKSQLSLF